MIGVELRKLLRRPRTWIVIALIDALPTLVAVLHRQDAADMLPSAAV